MGGKPSQIAARYRKLCAELSRIQRDPREAVRVQQILDELEVCWWKLGPKQRRTVPPVPR
jgi:hypothetical protein